MPFTLHLFPVGLASATIYCHRQPDYIVTNFETIHTLYGNHICTSPLDVFSTQERANMCHFLDYRLRVAAQGLAVLLASREVLSLDLCWRYNASKLKQGASVRLLANMARKHTRHGWQFHWNGNFYIPQTLALATGGVSKLQDEYIHLAQKPTSCMTKAHEVGRETEAANKSCRL